MSRPGKHSLTLLGHRTSVSLEPAFWDAFRDLAARDDIALNVLATRIDKERGTQMGLACAIRLYVLQRLQDELAARPPLALSQNEG
ncbi:MAG: putative DNA-binding ribbon-helix-helix protein [Paracoccaceae bacterium]|jgi:predicted DNA-binding ribbon-helix-helix protein